jgi:hypothetical protein
MAKTEFTIKKTLETGVLDMGRENDRNLVISVYHYDGRVVCSVSVKLEGHGWSQTDLFADTNAYLRLAQMPRYSPKSMVAYGKALYDNEARIFSRMADWHDDTAWDKESRAEMVNELSKLLQIGATVTA